MTPMQPEQAPKPTSGPAPTVQEPVGQPAAGWQMNDALGVNKYASPADGRTPLTAPGSPNGNPFGGRHAT
jgi:hypothetical protein